MRTHWKLLGGAGLVGAGLATWILLGHSRISRGDTTSTTSTTVSSSTIASPTGTGLPAPAEPITDTPAVTAPGWEQPPKDPFAPFDIGPGTHWAYADLTDAQKAVVDKGRDARGWDNINAAYASASAQVAHRAAASSAAAQIGITDDLATLGVVP